jgi:hypothetical protein
VCLTACVAVTTRCISLAPLLAAIDGLDAGGRALLFALCENAQVLRSIPLSGGIFT